jgi:CoA:oxalate CoA-transferase
MGAILAALYQRNATGQGQMVDVSMFETLVGMLLGEVNRAQFDFEIPSRPMYGPIEAKDGYVMLATASERTFQDMATAAGRRDWLTDPRFEKYADRRMNWAEFVDEFEQWSRKLTVKKCVAALEKHGVPCSPYLTVTEALQDPQVAHRGSLCTIEDSAGAYKSPAPPFRFSGSALQSGPKVADLGEHTRSVLAEAGLSVAEVEALLK